LLKLIPGIAPYLLGCAGALFLLFDLWRKRTGWWQHNFYRIFGRLLKSSEKEGGITGVTMFLITAAVISFIFPQKTAAAALLILTFADPLASLSGGIFPVKKIRGEKSLIGSLTFFLTSLLILSLFFRQSILYLSLVALSVTVAESFAADKLENFIIGATAAIMIALLL
ncbi:MAG: hypothetical protein ACE5GL_07035, partial [Calditrichia bacterium]